MVTPRLGLVGMDQHEGQSPPKIALFSGKLVGCLHFHLLQAGREQLGALVKPGSAVSSGLPASRAWAWLTHLGGEESRNRTGNQIHTVKAGQPAERTASFREHLQNLLQSPLSAGSRHAAGQVWEQKALLAVPPAPDLHGMTCS